MHVWPTLGDHRCLFRAVARGIIDPYNRVARDRRGEPLRDMDADMETRNAESFIDSVTLEVEQL